MTGYEPWQPAGSCGSVGSFFQLCSICSVSVCDWQYTVAAGEGFECTSVVVRCGVYFLMT